MNVAIADSSLGRMLDQVESRLLSTGTQGYVHKVEVTRKQNLQFELMLGDQPGWYEWEADEPRKLAIAADKKLPLAKRLSDEHFAAAVKILSYRPGRRLTLLDDSATRPWVLKGYRDGQLEKMIRKYEIAHVAFAGGGIDTPAIIELDTTHQSFAMVHQPGERLALSAESTDLFHLVGESLRGFQDHDPTSVETCFGHQDELAVIDKRAGRLAGVAGRLPDRWQELRSRIGSVEATLPAMVIGLAHRDLHDKQFVQHSNHLTLLDFDLMCKADTTLDAANFLAHLVLRNLQGAQGATQRSIDTCGKKFLQGLERTEEPGFWERLRFYQATSFCRLALVYALRPRWQHLVPDLVTMGNRCLDDLHRVQNQ